MDVPVCQLRRLRSFRGKCYHAGSRSVHVAVAAVEAVGLAAAAGIVLFFHGVFAVGIDVVASTS